MEQETQYVGGSVEMAIGSNLIDARLLGDITVNFVEGTRTTNSQAGVITKPSGLLTSAQVDGNFILPSVDALKILYEDLYEEALTSGLMGRIRIGGGTCKTKTTKPVNIHYVCDKNSNNDFHVFAGLVQLNLNFTYNAENDLVVPFSIFAQPTSENGYAIFGAGDREKETLWDHETQKWVEVPTTSTDSSDNADSE